MIYFLSDQHGGESIGDLWDYIDNAKEEDLLILLGDLGLRFEDNERNRAFDERLLASRANIALVDGNHENFKFLYSFPEEDWCGGKVHRLTDKIVHLQRGNVYEIEGKTFFVFGSCRSGSKWKDLGLWHPEEAPTEEQLSLAYSNLEKYGRKIDYILTHKYEDRKRNGTPELMDLCQFIDENVTYKMWYAGHWHESRVVDEKHVLVYDKLTPLFLLR